MSLWGKTARIDTELPGGMMKSYFLKVRLLPRYINQLITDANEL